MSDPIRILHVIRLMSYGGAESMIMNLYRNINRDKVQFDFVENSDDHGDYDDEIQRLGGKIYRCPHYNGRNHLLYSKWWDTFFSQHQEYKIIHGHLGSTAAIYLSIAKKHNVFTIAHCHNTLYLNSISNVIYKLYSIPTRYIADYYFACSMEAGVSRFGKRIVNKPDRFHMLPNAIDVEDYSYHKLHAIEMKTRLGLDGQMVIGHVGQFRKQKNHLFLMDVFYHVLQKNENCRMMLVGSGPEIELVKQYVKKLGMEDKVLFLGARSDVPDLLQAMDVFAFPSLYEGLPVTLVEAQTSGLPCVISDKVPLESVLTDGLVTVMRLRDSADQWAEHILSRMDETRYSRVEEIKARGFDIRQESKWMEDYYVSKYEEH